MGISVAAQSGVIGGQNDPAMSTLDNSGGPFHGQYVPIPPNRGTADTWYCIGYHRTGTPPSKTWVAFVKTYNGEANVTINGSTFDLRGLVVGEVMLYTAYGDGNAANPWQVTYAFSVLRGTSGALGDASAYPVLFIGNGFAYDFTTAFGVTTVTQFGPPQSLPFAATYDTLDSPTYDPLGLNLGFTTDVWWNSFLFVPIATVNKGYSAFTAVVGPGPASYTTDTWVPGGLGATGSQPPQSWFQSQGVNQEWGLPDQTFLKCRMFTANDQLAASIPTLKVASGGVKNFFVSAIAWDSRAAELGGIASRVFSPRALTSYGTRDLLATRVRPQFIDQSAEGGGGIFLETNDS